MNEQSLRPPKKRGVFSPVLIELTIVILFFALSTSVVIQLIAAGSDISNESCYHARALLAMESVAEQIKADPTARGEADDCGVYAFTLDYAADLAVSCVVTENPSPAQGSYYEIALSVTAEDGSVYSLEAAKYVSGGEVAP